MKQLFLLLTVIFLATKSFAQSGDEQEIRTLLSTQVSAWNAGSVEGYMHGYWENDSLVFIGKNGPTYGFAATLARYKKSYPDAAAMGQLSSTVISLKRLSPDYYFVIGHWALARKAGDLSGSWTLLFHKIAGHWVIVVDHSS